MVEIFAFSVRESHATCRFRILLEDVFLKMDPHGHEKITISQFEHIFADEDNCFVAFAIV